MTQPQQTVNGLIHDSGFRAFLRAVIAHCQGCAQACRNANRNNIAEVWDNRAEELPAILQDRSL